MAIGAAVQNVLQGLAGPQPNVQEYQRLWEASRRARISFDAEAWLNLAFFNNLQYVEWIASSGSLREIPRPAGTITMPRPVSNKIMHFVEQEHAMLLQTRPNIDVLPASEDPSSISIANVAESFLNWASDANVANVDQELAIAAKYALAGTEGFLKWFWNKRKNRVDVCACSPFDVYPDPYAKKFSDCRYIIHSQFMDTEQVYDIYGIETQPTGLGETIDPSKLSVMQSMGFAPVLNGALVHELWMKPNRRYPDGLFVVWTNRQILCPPTAFPYKHGQLPFTQLGSILRPGTPHYTSAVSYLRSPQMELNKFHAQMIQVRENYSNPKWWIPSDLSLESDPDDSPNQILRGDSQGGTLMPQIIQPAAMPPNDQGAWIANEMSDVVGIHEVSQAQVPGRVEAAKSIELLKESDDGRLAEMLRTVANSLSTGGYQWLMLAKQYMTSSQMIPTYSPEGLPEIKRLYADKLDPGMTVRVLMGTGLSRSRAAREDTLMLMWNAGIITDANKMSELMEVPISDSSPDDVYDLRLARNENFTMSGDATGKPVPVVPNSWDNHDIHRREHNNYRKTQEFLQLDDKTKTMFEYHVQMHDKLQVQQMSQDLQRQSLAMQLAQAQQMVPQSTPDVNAVQDTPEGGAPPPGKSKQQMPGTSGPPTDSMGQMAPMAPSGQPNATPGQAGPADPITQQALNLNNPN